MSLPADNFGLSVAELKARVLTTRIAILLSIKNRMPRWLNYGAVPFEDLYQVVWEDYAITTNVLKLTLPEMEKAGLLLKTKQGHKVAVVLTELGEAVLAEIKTDFDNAFKAWEGVIL